MALTDRLPPELHSEIFHLLAKEKVDGRSFPRYRSGFHLVPFLESASLVSWKWRHFILEDRAKCTRALTITFEGSSRSWIEAIQYAFNMTTTYATCQVLASFSLKDFDDDPLFDDHQKTADLIRLFRSCCGRLLAIEGTFSTLEVHTAALMAGFHGLFLPDLEHFSAVTRYYRGGPEFLILDVVLSSAATLSGSVFMSLPPENSPEPEAAVYTAPLCYAALNHLTGFCMNASLRYATGIRVEDREDQLRPPTWTELCGIIKRNPDLQVLNTQVSGGNSRINRMPDLTCLYLSSLTKCSLEANARDIWTFLSIKGIANLKHLSLSFNLSLTDDDVEPIPTTIIGMRFPQLVYLSLYPLCPTTCQFLARTLMASLATLIILGRPRLRWNDVMELCQLTISLPALITLKAVGCDIAAVVSLMQALCCGFGTPAPLTVLELNIDQSRLDREDRCYGFSAASFPASPFFNIVSLSIERVHVDARLLRKFLPLLPSVRHLCLGLATRPGRVLSIPLYDDKASEFQKTLLLPKLVSLDVEFSPPMLPLHTPFDSERYSGVSLVEFVRRRVISGAPLELLRVNLGLPKKTIAEIEQMKCSVVDRVNFPDRYCLAHDFNAL